MNVRLDDQVAFVAGSSRGIGRAIAAQLLDAGARIVLTGRDADALEATRVALSAGAPSDRVLAIAGDLADPAVVEAALDRTLATFGRLDHVVANLGTGRGQPGWDVDRDEWDRLFAINFFAPVRIAQAALPRLSSPGGSLLFIASIVAIEATPAPLPYSAAKAALVNYAKNLARRVAPAIRVNAIAPGNIDFEGGSWERLRASDPAGVAAMIEREVPLKRFGTPDEIAAFAVFLCSPHAAFATGACHVVDGGQTRSL